MSKIEGPGERCQDQDGGGATQQDEACPRHRPGDRMGGMGGAWPRAVDGQAIGVDGARDVLEVLFAQVFGAQHQLADDLFVDRGRDADAADLRDRLQPHRHVHGIAHQVVAAFDHVAQVDADSQGQLIVGLSRRIGRAHGFLDFQGGAHRLDRAREFGQQPVAGHLEDAAAMLAHERAGRIESGGQQGQRMLLVARRHGAECHHVEGEDRREPSNEICVGHFALVSRPKLP